MRLMEEMILREGTILPGGVLKVGSFLNQRIDPALLRAMGEEIARLFADCGVTKLLTIESSGIAIAASAAMAMDLPMVFAKKHRTSNVDGAVLSTVVHSFTHGMDYNAVVSRDYLTSEDCVLLVDDFLASGAALEGLARLADQAGARLAGAAVAIEKRFQGGGDALRDRGLRVESLAQIARMDGDEIVFTGSL
ncbi:MAG: xanthine phosphoribosyltransferase [Oscillospiraceae bacterium]|nr:xanthine phosphoribosyltransferase [Oscillospiraceae bacterium]